MKKAPLTSNKKRSAARLGAVQSLYSCSINQKTADRIIHDFTDSGNVANMGTHTIPVNTNLYQKIIYGVNTRNEELVKIANRALKKRSIEQQEILVRVILKAGIFELIENVDTDHTLIISEYVKITQTFFDKKKSGMVNGVLDTIAREMRS